MSDAVDMVLYQAVMGTLMMLSIFVQGAIAIAIMTVGAYFAGEL